MTGLFRVCDATKKINNSVLIIQITSSSLLVIRLLLRLVLQRTTTTTTTTTTKCFTYIYALWSVLELYVVIIVVNAAKVCFYS